MNFSWLTCVLVPFLALEASSVKAQGWIDVQKPEKFRESLVLNLKAEPVQGRIAVDWPEALTRALAIQKVWIEYPLAGMKLGLMPPKALRGDRILFDEPPRSRLFQGLEARILLEVSPIKGLYVLPLSAIGGYSNASTFVYARRDQSFIKVPVTLLPTGGPRMLAIADLQDSDRVVVKGLHKIFAQRELNLKEVEP